MFYAMAEHKIDTRGHRFEHILQDIETLNQRALRGELHISAVSIHACAYLADRYSLLPCGASMGDGYGPMLVTLEEPPGDLDGVRKWVQPSKWMGTTVRARSVWATRRPSAASNV